MISLSYLMGCTTRVPIKYKQCDTIYKGGVNPQLILMYGLKAGTNFLEVGIPSNRVS